MAASGYNRGRDQRNRVHQPEQPCRSCGRRMLWVTMPSGKRNPLDLDALPPGCTAPANVIVVELAHPSHGDKWRLGTVIHDPDLLREAVELGFTPRTSHFATCQSDERRPRDRADLA